MDHSSDIELMRELAKGSRSAFQKLYQQYGGLVYGYTKKLVKDTSTAEDLTQEVWLRVVRQAPSYKGLGSLRSWILTVCRNLVMSYFRKQKVEISFDDNQEELSDLNANEVENALISSLELDDIKNKIELLPYQQKVALTLWLTEKLSYEQLADEMGTSVSAVKSLLFRARKSLEITKERPS